MLGNNQVTLESLTRNTLLLYSNSKVITRASRKESACNAEDSGSIIGLRRSPGEEIGYPLQYWGASLVAEMVKSLPAMWETWVWSLCLIPMLGRSSGEGQGTHSSVLAWRIPMDRGTWRATVHGLPRVRNDWMIKHTCAQGYPARWFMLLLVNCDLDQVI